MMLMEASYSLPSLKFYILVVPAQRSRLKSKSSRVSYGYLEHRRTQDFRSGGGGGERPKGTQNLILLSRKKLENSMKK